MSSNPALDAVLKIQVNKRKKVTESVVVIEAFKERYIVVQSDLNNSYHLKWNKTLFLYTGSFLESTFSCKYDVINNFTAVKIKEGTNMPSEVVSRSKSGRPASMQ
jgi:hypothetical protein